MLIAIAISIYAICSIAYCLIKRQERKTYKELSDRLDRAQEQLTKSEDIITQIESHLMKKEGK